MGRSVDELIAGLPKARRLKVEAKSQQLAREMSLVVHTKDGNDIVLHSLGDLSGNTKASPKPKRAASSKSPRRSIARQVA
jgi:hypothetical protein